MEGSVSTKEPVVGLDREKLLNKLTIECALTRDTPEGKGWIEAMNAVKYWTKLGDFDAPVANQDAEKERRSPATQERDFTPEEALTEAQRRWGQQAMAVFLSYYEPNERCRVAKHTWPLAVNCWMGSTFKAAFVAADRAELEAGAPEGK
jgi:hypothetical protein